MKNHAIKKVIAGTPYWYKSHSHLTHEIKWVESQSEGKQLTWDEAYTALFSIQELDKVSNFILVKL